MPKKNPPVLNIDRDYPDDRDWPYRPSLNTIAYPELRPTDHLSIMDQKSDGACAGYALAATINLLLHRSGRTDEYVSARMLYLMARRHDEWAGEDYEGSSIRGAIKGWKNMGVCDYRLWHKRYPKTEDDLTVERAKDARKRTLGAYYRLQPEITHFHAALNDIGVIYVSAATHSGWNAEKASAENGGLINFAGETPMGGHAFAIIGYTEKGFLIQNSWGKGWGADGLGIWQYEDWHQSHYDAWVVQLGYPTPEIFDMGPALGEAESNIALRKTLFSPKRNKIMGHFVHVDDGKFHGTGKYWSTDTDVRETATQVAHRKDYRHFLIYAHGGLNSPKDSARRIEAMKPVYMGNGIYPYHLMYDVGLGEELKDIVARKFNFFKRRAGGIGDIFKGGISDIAKALIEKTDLGIENTARAPGTAVWDEMKRGAETAFAKSGAGTLTWKAFQKAFAEHSRSAANLQIHLAGHSTGAIVIARFLEMLRRERVKLHIDTIHLMAPAITVNHFESAYGPILTGKLSRLSIGRVKIFNLRDKDEIDDNVAGAYRKSLLCLVSNAFEREKGKPILGMERFEGDIPEKLLNLPQVEVVYASSRSSETRSESHGGFDNDRRTMNSILKGILGGAPTRSFTKDDLTYGKILF